MNRFLRVGLGGTVAVLCCFAPVVGLAQEEETPPTSSVTDPAVNVEPAEDVSAVVPGAACNQQEPQQNLIRGNFIRRRGLTDEEREARRQLHEDSIRYRTENYGYFDGFGEPEWNENTPRENSEEVEFMGREVRLNRRIIPALRCVEEVILAECVEYPYEPRRLSGLRTRNTYHTDEVSNHVYGIAIDIDPSRNTCCGCVGEWAEHPLCEIETDNIYDRMVMPECWVHVFERYGFYWLGHDRLRDTMHFEFLGDPNLILVDEGQPDQP